MPYHQEIKSDLLPGEKKRERRQEKQNGMMISLKQKVSLFRKEKKS